MESDIVAEVVADGPDGEDLVEAHVEETKADELQVLSGLFLQ